MTPQRTAADMVSIGVLDVAGLFVGVAAVAFTSWVALAFCGLCLLGAAWLKRRSRGAVTERALPKPSAFSCVAPKAGGYLKAP